MFAQKNTPRHLFNAGHQTLTPASSASPRTIGDGYLRAIGTQLGWSPGDIAGTYVAKEYRTEHNGVTHLVYKQQFGGLEVFNSDFVLNIDRPRHQRRRIPVLTECRSDRSAAVGLCDDGCS
jgi:hypothetical protein